MLHSPENKHMCSGDKIFNLQLLKVLYASCINGLWLYACMYTCAPTRLGFKFEPVHLNVLHMFEMIQIQMNFKMHWNQMICQNCVQVNY